MAADTAHSYDHQSNLLVYGYIHDLNTIYKNLNIPNEIKQIIFIFYLLDIAPQMIFDKESITKAGLCKIINDNKIKMVMGPGGHSDTQSNADWGSSAKLKYGISLNPNDYTNVKSISWKVKIRTSNFPDAYYFIGVVSNRTNNFKRSVWSTSDKRLIDAYGISGLQYRIYDARVSKSWPWSNSVYDTSYKVWKMDEWVAVKYVIKEQKLIYNYIDYRDEIDRVFTISLPTNIKGYPTL